MRDLFRTRRRRTHEPTAKPIGPGTAVVSVVCAHVLGPHFAAALHGRHLDVEPNDSFRSLWRVPSHLSDPAAVWNIHGVLPGPGLYWTVVIATVPLAGLTAIGSRRLAGRLISFLRGMWWRIERPDLAHLRVGDRSDMLSVGRHGRHTYAIPNSDRTAVLLAGRDRHKLEQHVTSWIAHSDMHVVVCTSNPSLADTIVHTVPGVVIIDLQARIPRARWNPLSTIASYHDAREHAALLTPHNEDIPPLGIAKPAGSATDIVAALLWTAARSDEPSIRDVHHWANQPDPVRAIAPLVAALRHHTDPHIAWDAAIIERDLHTANNHSNDITAWTRAWDNPLIVQATTGQPSEPAHVTIICDPRPSPTRTAAMKLIAHSLVTTTGGVLVIDDDRLHGEPTLAPHAMRIVLSAADSEPPPATTVRIAVENNTLALSHRTSGTDRFGPPVRLRPAAMGRSGPGPSRGAQSRPPHPHG